MPTESYVEDNPIILPVLKDGVTSLGDLWDCHQSKFVGENLFKGNLDGEFIKRNSHEGEVYKLIHCKSTSNKIETIDVGGEMSVELLSGLIAVKGSANFNSDQTEIKNREQLICYSRIEKFTVEVLNTAKKVVDDDVKKSLINGLKATHFVRRLTLGAEVNADILVTQNNESSTSDVKSDFFDKIVYGSVNAEVKAKLNFLDNKDVKNFKKEINVNSSPSMERNPTSVEDMFSLIENIKTVVDKHKYLPKIDEDVIGVPISFYLVPIKQFLDFDVEKLYLKLSDKVVNEFKAMLVLIHDIQVLGYIFKKVLEMNPTLAIILHDIEHKICCEIRSYEKKLRDIVVKYFEESVKILKQYKVKKANSLKINQIIRRFQKDCNSSEILEKTVKFKEEGEAELRSLGYDDISDSKIHFYILTNRNSLKQFISGEKEIKIWLHTNDKAPEGVFLRLHEINKSLTEKNLKIGIAVKSISPKFQLCVKVKGKENTYDDLEEIPYILSIIGAAAGVGHDNELLFHSMNAELMKIKLPFKSQKEFIDINYLIEKCRILKNVIITQTHFETMALLTTNDDKWKFFMPIDANQTSFLAFRHLYNLTSMDKDIDLIVGNLNNTEYSETGFLFLIKNSKVEAVCLDDLDLILLKDQFLNNLKNVLSILSPVNMNKSFYPERARSCEAIIESIEFQLQKKLNTNEYGLESFQENPNDALMKSLELACALRNFKEIDFIATMTKLALQESKELETILLKAGLSLTNYKFLNETMNWETNHPLISSVIKSQNIFSMKIDKLINVLNTVIEAQDDDLQKCEEKVSEVLGCITSDQNCTEELKRSISDYASMELKFRCTKIKFILEKNKEQQVIGDKLFHLSNFYSFLVKPSENQAINILKKYINRISLDENIFCKEKENFLKELELKHYNRLISSLSKCSVGEKYYILHKELENYCQSNNRTTAILSLLNKLIYNDLFNDNHWQDIWKNSRFQELIKSESDDQRVLSRLLQMGCQDNVPDYIPQDIAHKIDKLRDNDRSFEIPDEFKNFDEFAKILREMDIRKCVPEEFRGVLRDSIEKNLELNRELEDKSILKIFKWDFNSRIFRHPIMNEFIEEVVNMIDEMENSNDNSSQQETIDVNQFNHFCIPKLYSEEPICEKIKLIPKNLSSVFGNSIQLINYKEFVCLSTLLKKPLLESKNLKQGVVKILPYIIQKIKMWGCNAATADSISSFIDIELESNEKDDRMGTEFNRPRFGKERIQDSPRISKREEEVKFPLSRIDTITGVINSMDAIVSQDILNIMAKFPVALPLIIRELNAKDSFKNLIPWLTQTLIKWESSPGRIIENHLFVDKFKMIVTLRIGNCSDGRCGKSTILNQILLAKNMFSCCGEPGAKTGKPFTVDGSVEFVLLTKETADPKLWESVLQKHYESGINEVICLANIHGNALKFENHLKALKLIASTYIFFIMPEDIENLKDSWNILENILEIGEEKKKIFYVAIDPSSEESFPTDVIIDTSKMTDDSNIEKLRNVLKKCLINHGKKINLKTLESFGNNKQQQTTTKIILSELIETKASQALIGFIEKNSCKYVKKIMSLQRGYKTHKNCEAVWSKNDQLLKVIQLMVDVLYLKCDSRLKAMLHIEKELNRISAVESRDARQKYYDCHNQLQKIIGASGHDLVMAAELRKDAKKALNEIDNVNLGLEHFYREIGKIYGICLDNSTKTNPYTKVAEAYGELFAGGHPIELLDGDLNEILEPWLGAIFNDVYIKYPKMRIFVISILGLQSSGKSTLLNAMFACKFAVSVGRCTKGLFMRLLFLDEKLKTTLNFDAILLIDTEGLGAPEKQNDRDAERRDRVMATFAMSISHLTIVNVLGEYTNHLTAILQIAIVAMAKLEKADISPDIMMVQHLTERSNDKLINACQQFSDALEKAIELVDIEDIDLGIRDSKCLNTLRCTISKGNLFHQFCPFKNGASANSPPSDEYHQDVVKLYKYIIDIADNSENKADFKNWQLLIGSYWDRIKNENLMSLKDMKALQEYIQLGEIMAKVKESIESAFRVHSKVLEEYITEQMKKINLHEVTRENVLKSLKEKLKLVPIICSPVSTCYCKEFMKKQSELFDFVAKKPSEKDTRETVKRIINKTREWHLNQLSQMMDAKALRQVESAETLNKIDKYLKDSLKTGKTLTEVEINNLKEKIWDDLKKDASDRVKQFRVHDQILDEIKNVYKDGPQFIENLKENSVENLRQIPAIHKIKTLKALNERETRESNFPDDEFFDELNRKIIELPDIILADNYQPGMIAKLKKKVRKIIIDSEKTLKTFDLTYDTEFKWTLYSVANQRFMQKMLEKQLKWEENNNPLTILEKNRHEYISIITLRLTYGVNYISEGRIVGEKLLSAIKEKVLKDVNEQMVNDVLGIDWLSNSQSVRLKYFSELVEQVKHDNFNDALNHFDDPKRQIENWFVRKVNDFTKGKVSLKFKEIFTIELNQAKREIKSKSKINDIIDYISKDFFDCEIKLDKSLDVTKANETEIDIFRTQILEALNDNQISEITSKIEFTNPSSDKLVDHRKGCNFACPLCSALCWSGSGHHDDQGEGSRHHTCHQPLGLSAVHENKTKKLVCHSCDYQDENQNWHKGDKLMKWSSFQKLEKYSTWKFETHVHNQFNQMMKWFFFKINNDIARRKDLNPPDMKVIKKFGLDNLNIDSIMELIKSKI